MASALIATVQWKVDKTGLDQSEQGLERVQQQMQRTAASAKDVGTSFSSLKNIIVGTALTLPLAGFVKEAIQSEEVTARMGLQFKALGQSIENINLEAVSRQVRNLAGITQTELVTALGTGIRYFKDADKELKYLNTAIGMTKVSGVSLSTAFQQLGYITMGYTRVARQYGISMHNEIKNPTERANAILADFQKSMEPLAKQTGTTSEALKIMGASIKDIGEKVGSQFLAPIGEIAKVFNNMDDSMKEIAITTVLLGGAIWGLSTAFKVLNAQMAGNALLSIFSGVKGILSLPIANLSKIQMILIGLKGALGALVVPTALIASFAAFVYSEKKLKDSKEELAKVDRAAQQDIKNALKVRVSDATTSMDAEQKFAEKLKETQKVYMDFSRLEGIAISKRQTGAAAVAKAQKEQVKALYERQLAESKTFTAHGTSTLAEELKYQTTIANLKIAGSSDSLNKELKMLRVKLIQEKHAYLAQFTETEEYRVAFAEKGAQEAADVRKKWLQKELGFFLQTKEQQIAAEKDYNYAKMTLAGMSKEDFKQSSDVELKRQSQVKGPNDKSAFEERIELWSKEEEATAKAALELKAYYYTLQEVYALYKDKGTKTVQQLDAEAKAIRANKQAQLEGKSAGVNMPDSFTQEKTVAVAADLNFNTTVNITPNVEDIATRAATAIQDVVIGFQKRMEETFQFFRFRV